MSSSESDDELPQSVAPEAEDDVDVTFESLVRFVV